MFWDASAESLGIGTSSIDLTSSGRTVVQVEGSSNALLNLTDGTSRLYLHQKGGTSGADIWNSANSYMRFATNDTERMRIDSSGNVGIGTDSPSAPLHIGKSGAAAELWLQRTDGYNPVKLFGSTLGDGQGFKINVNSNDAFAINSSGNVGIGTDNPAANSLTIEKSGTARLRLTESGVRAWDIEATSGDFRINNASGSSEAMRIDSAGNVGIGTSSPSSPLEVAGGSAYPTTKFSRDGGSAATQGYLTTGFSAIGYSGGTGADAYLVAEHGFGFAVNAGTNALVITDGGNVGIGTDSPDTLLHLSDTLGGAVLRLERNDTGIVATDQYGAIEFEGQDANAGANGVRASMRAVAEASVGQTSLTFSTAGQGVAEAEAMRIDSSGNVGIGTTSVALAGGGGGLHIDHGSIPEIKLTNSTTGSGAGDGTALQANGNNFNIINREAGNIAFQTAATERMRIDSSGNLLVGTTALTPGNGNTDTGHLLKNDGRLFVSSASNSQFNRNSAGNIVTFRQSGNSVGSIGTDGTNVYIGSGDTTLKMDQASDGIFPRGTDGVQRDGAIQLGSAGNRFSDLYLSGGVYLGGTGSANKLDDYEEGTFNPIFSINGNSTNLGSVPYTYQYGNYRKVGKVVYFMIDMSANITTTTGNFISVSGLPFTAANGTINTFPTATFRDCNAVTVASGHLLSPWVNASTSYIYLQVINLQTNVSTSDLTTWDSSGRVCISGFYFTI